MNKILVLARTMAIISLDEGYTFGVWNDRELMLYFILKFGFDGNPCGEA